MQQVTVVPTISSDRDLSGNASGMVTADWSGDGLISGKGAYQVNDRTVVALNTATPLVSRFEDRRHRRRCARPE